MSAAADVARARLRRARQERLERTCMTRNLGALVTELVTLCGRSEYSVAAERRLARLVELEGHTLDGLDREIDHRLEPKVVWQLGIPSFEQVLS